MKMRKSDILDKIPFQVADHYRQFLVPEKHVFNHMPSHAGIYTNVHTLNLPDELGKRV